MKVGDIMKLVLVRHGESIWNLEHRFTGWTDVELTKKGIEEAKSSGEIIKQLNIDFGIAYTSYLKRASDTLKYILEIIGPVKTRASYKLNERHYGALQGRTHEEVEREVGKEQVLIWRRSYDVKPPELDITDARFPGNDPKYKDILKFELPLSESLKDTLERVTEYFESEISTFLRIGENVLVVASGNTLRALVKYLEHISDEDIMKLEIKTGEVIVYDLDDELHIKHKNKYNVSN